MRTLAGIVMLLAAAVGAVRLGWIPTEDESAVVARVIDGDTAEMADGTVVRVAGIDTPERGKPCFDEATSNLRRIIEGQTVTLVSTLGDDTDRWGRAIRYVDVGDLDAGRAQIKEGYAVARYDSRDGYDAHPRERDYRRLDDRTTSAC